METNKGVISLNLDNDLIEIINSYSNRSAKVNEILREHLFSEEILEKEIREAKKHLEKLEEKRSNKDSFLNDINQEMLNIINPPQLSGDELLSRVQRDTRKVKDIIDQSNDPGEILITWTKIINNRFGTSYSPNQFRQILEKYS